MNSRALEALAALVMALAIALPEANSQAPAAKYRVVIQVSDADPGKWNLALSNAQNVQADLGKTNVEIEIVAYGPGIDMLTAESAARDRVSGAIDDGVIVVACENTMRTRKLQRGDMLGGIGYVDAGVVELMQKQRAGWAYIRP